MILLESMMFEHLKFWNTVAQRACERTPVNVEDQLWLIVDNTLFSKMPRANPDRSSGQDCTRIHRSGRLLLHQPLFWHFCNLIHAVVEPYFLPVPHYRKWSTARNYMHKYSLNDTVKMAHFSICRWARFRESRSPFPRQLSKLMSRSQRVRLQVGKIVSWSKHRW